MLAHSRIFLAMLLALSPYLGQATHMSGGEIYFECLGNDEYEVSLIIYRDCAGVDLANNFDANFTSPCGSFTVQVNTPTGEEISQLCNTELPNSTCSGGTLPGLERYIYSTTVTLPPCDFWTASWSLQNRNGAIVNLDDPGQKEMYIEATLNNAQSTCNNSPQFDVPASSYVCLSYPISYSFGATDVDADSLTYELIGARGQGAALLPYIAPNTGIEPIPGLTLNTQTGIVNFTLNQAGNWVVVVRVNEFDSLGNWIGSVMRDMQFVGYPCSNIPPNASAGTITNANGSATVLNTNSIQMCESGSTCFDVIIDDANPNNILIPQTNVTNALPGATFTYTGTNPITCTICWDGYDGAAGFYPFVITVDDGACPIPAAQSYAYTIQVIDGVFLDVQASDASCQGIADGSVSANVQDGTAPYQYTWSTGANTPTIAVDTGYYFVSVTDANGCVSSTDTAFVQGPTRAESNAGPDVVHCVNSGQVNVNGTSVNAASVVWLNGNGTVQGTNASLNYSPTAQDIANGGTSLLFVALSSNTCPNDSSFANISIGHDFSGDTVIQHPPCYGDTNGSLEYVPDLGHLSYTWNTNPQQFTAGISGLGAGNYSITIADTLGCDTSISIALIEPSELVIDSLIAFPPSCAGNATGSIQAFVSGGTPNYSYDWGAGPTNNVLLDSLNDGVYAVIITDENDCTVSGGTAITSPAPVSVSLFAPDTVCVNSTVLLVANATGGAGNYTYDWFGLGTGDSVYYSFANDTSIVVGVTDSNGCNSPFDSENIHVLDLSNFTLSTLGDTVICPGGTAQYGASVAGYGGSVTISWPTTGNLGNGPFSIMPSATIQLPVSVSNTCGQQLNELVTVTVETPPVVSLPDTIAIGCEELEVQFLSPLGNSYVHFWDLGDGTSSSQMNPTANYSAGIYSVNLGVTSAIGCPSGTANPSIVLVHENPVADFTANPWATTLDNPDIQFTNTSIGTGLLYAWDFADGYTSALPDPLHSFTSEGSFPVFLHVEDYNGCQDSVIRDVEIEASHVVQIPTAFTPSGNGGGGFNPNDLSNDVFHPFAASAVEMRMQIYNRWGELIFESNEINRGWDGTYKGEITAQDNYVYVIWLRFSDNTSTELTGDITVIR